MPSSESAGGYGKPPVSSRFQKGKSGNPKGRPKKSSKSTGLSLSVNDLIVQEAGRPMTITEGGQLIELTALQVLVKGLFRAAMKGGAAAQKILFSSLIEASKEFEAARREQVKIETSDPHEAARQYRRMLDAGGGNY